MKFIEAFDIVTLTKIRGKLKKYKNKLKEKIYGILINIFISSSKFVLSKF